MDHNHKLIKMHYQNDGNSGWDIPVIILMNFVNLGFIQSIIGFVSLFYVLFRFLKQVKEAGGFYKYFKEWIDLLNLFKPNGKNNNEIPE